MDKQTTDTNFADLAASYEQKAALLLKKLIIWTPWAIDSDYYDYGEWVVQLTGIELAKHIAAVECMLLDIINSNQGRVSIDSMALNMYPYIYIWAFDANEILASIRNDTIWKRMSEFSSLPDKNSHFAWLGISTFILEDPALFKKIDCNITLKTGGCKAWISLKPDAN